MLSQLHQSLAILVFTGNWFFVSNIFLKLTHWSFSGSSARTSAKQARLQTPAAGGVGLTRWVPLVGGRRDRRSGLPFRYPGTLRRSFIFKTFVLLIKCKEILFFTLYKKINKPCNFITYLETHIKAGPNPHYVIR